MSVDVRWKKATVRFAFAAWALVVVIAGALLMGPHWLALPGASSVDARLVAEMASRASAASHASRGAPGDARSWDIVHALRSGCRCSEGVLEHLIARRRFADVTETIVIADDDADRVEEGTDLARRAALTKRVQDAGFQFERLTTAALEARFGIVAAPLFVVADPSGVVRYAGGYTLRKQSPVVVDARIFSRVRAGEDVAPLPVFGCPVSPELAARVDPLGLR